MSNEGASAFSAEERERIISAAMRHNRLSRNDAELMFESIGQRRAKRNPILEEQWASLLHRMCVALRNGKADPPGIFESVFWIRLYGALTEIPRRFAFFREWADETASTSRDHPWITSGAAVFAACEALRSSLSEEELVFVAFLRHVQAHVYQEGFEFAIEPPGPRGRGAVRTGTTVPTAGSRFEVDEVHAIVDRIHAALGGEESRIAETFGEKVGPAARDLHRALAEHHAIRKELGG
jgi:hypothetical protein